MWVSWLIALAGLFLGAYSFFYNNKRKALELDAKTTSLLTPTLHSRRLELPGIDQAPMLVVGPESRSFNVTPSKIAAGRHYQLRVLVEGRPQLTIMNNPLIDTDVVIGINRRKQELRRLRLLPFIGFLLILIQAIGLTLLTVYRNQIQTQHMWLIGDFPIGPPWAMLVIYSIPAGIVISALLITYTSKRLKRIRLAVDRVFGKERG
ncbi:hypothetical protein [Mycobacteroides abscessus]|uniref:hypothetical protein n=1 Tax=Mycobacteroides abscessus TaxID=36809 RepID=UPI000D3E22E7|nr:hypothetical protein [Mycobacteroides abscessus]PVB26988.1 hypothetical protein DDJ45_13905 [Mycobacteroides abscessus]